MKSKWNQNGIKIEPKLNPPLPPPPPVAPFPLLHPYPPSHPTYPPTRHSEQQWQQQQYRRASFVSVVAPDNLDSLRALPPRHLHPRRDGRGQGVHVLARPQRQGVGRVLWQAAAVGGLPGVLKGRDDRPCRDVSVLRWRWRSHLPGVPKCALVLFIPILFRFFFFVLFWFCFFVIY